jgi:MFS transporter, FHS family, L-fucose permease
LASILLYGFFLFALFVMACGQGVLEVAANPYVTILGAPESSERRLNLNAVGAWVTPFIGAAFILSRVDHSRTQLQEMTPSALRAYQAAEASTVKTPYLVVTGLFLAVAALIYFADLPEVREENGEAEPVTQGEGLGGLWQYKHLIRGVLAQFFYVGAQVGVASFVIRFAQYTMPGSPAKLAAHYLQWHLTGFMLGRFTGSAIMKHVPASRLLSLFGIAALTCPSVVLWGQARLPSGRLFSWASSIQSFFPPSSH